jgi:AraC family transcriptional regulator
VLQFRTSVIDLDASPGWWAGCSFDNVHYHVPRDCIEDIATDRGIRRIGSFRQTVIEDDLVLAQLTKNILPATTNRDIYSPLALDHFQLVLAAHLVQQYSGVAVPDAPVSGGLAPWQKRRATELLNENLNGKVRLSCLAKECGLSMSHFARSFKSSFGTSSHKWLIERRVDRAKQLLIQTALPLADLAAQSGFGDQASFTRTFHRITGASPGRRRRDYLSK